MKPVNSIGNPSIPQTKLASESTLKGDRGEVIEQTAEMNLKQFICGVRNINSRLPKTVYTSLDEMSR